MGAILRTQTTGHWITALEAVGVPCGPVYSYAEMFADPQVEHREMVVYAVDDELGEAPHIRTPIRIGKGVQVRTTAPKSGEHNNEIFGHMGVDTDELKALRDKRILIDLMI